MRVIRIAVAILSLTVAYAAGDAKAGKAAYYQHCKNCHGETGIANPKIAKMMNVEIPNLGSATVQKMTNEELSKVITEGKGKMPAIKSVTGKSVDDVIAYVLTLKK